jgi:type I restriction enzyme S subunit
MRPLTPIDRALATCCTAWPREKIDQPSIAALNPESLEESTPPNFEFRYIDIGSVTEGRVDWNEVAHLKFADAPSRARRVVRFGDTLICTVRPLLKSHAYANANWWADGQAVPIVCSTGFAVVRCDSKLLPAFFKHLPFSEQVVRQLVAWQCGTNYPAVNEADIRQLRVPIPSPNEQLAIARTLDAVDAAMEKTNAAVDRASDVKRALMQRLFSCGTRREPQVKTAIGFIPKSWTVATVSSVVRTFQYGLSVPMKEKGTLPILRMGNIQDGEVRMSDLKFVSLEAKQTDPYLLNRGDVLFNRTNSKEWVGKVGIFRHDTATVFASYLIRLIPDASKIDNYYLGHVLNSYSAQCRIKRYATPGVQQVNINATNLGKVFIPVPVGPDGLSEQKEIAVVLEAAERAVRSYQAFLDTQRALKASLTYRLLTEGIPAQVVAPEEAA